MDFQVLGPLEVRGGDGPLLLGGERQRAVLALLLLSAIRVVGRERLIHDLWGEEPPATAVATLQGYVSRLRKLLPEDVLLTRPPGYLLVVEPAASDLLRFESLVAEARGVDLEGASELFREALGLWRGPALAEFASEPFAQVAAARLENLRLAALDELRLLANRVDPVPEEVTSFADAALGWRRIDAELAELLADSALESTATAAAVRSGDRARSVTFRSTDLEIDLEIQSGDGGVTILGQLAPAGHALIEVERDDESKLASAEADDLGRFRLELAEAGRVRLRVWRDDHAPVETSWISR